MRSYWQEWPVQRAEATGRGVMAGGRAVAAVDDVVSSHIARGMAGTHLVGSPREGRAETMETAQSVAFGTLLRHARSLPA